MRPTIKLKKLHKEAKILGSGLYACLLNDQGRPTKAILSPFQSKEIGTGLAIEPPQSREWLTFLTTPHNLALRSVAVTPGFVEIGQRIEIKVILYNGSQENHYVSHEDLIAHATSVFASFPYLLEAK